MSIFSDIIDWVEDKPKFWKVGIDRLIRNNQLTSSDIAELKEICKSEFGLSKKEFDEIDLDALKELAIHSSSGDSLILSKIYNIENINALSKESELDFAPSGLTVVYGDWKIRTY